MRELKFRAWDKTHKKMLDRVLAGPGDPCSIVWDDEREEWQNFDEFCGDIMQYTGLKDKNGRDIYEGDIVRINHPADRTGDFTNAVGEVFWDDEEGAWYHTNNNDRPPKRMWKYVEVIGNIYEHPERLEGKQ